MPAILRRYTPPTCTLEVRANESALSRWTDRTIVDRLRFKLHFDDPRLPSDQQVTLEGDRAALEALSTVVDDYVQGQLLDPQEVLSLGVIASDAEHYRAIALQTTPAVAATVPQSESLVSTRMSLQPKGALSHVLNLGELATEASGESLTLSTIQLFDLATALQDCTSDIVTIASTKPRATWLNPSSGWLRAAAVMVLALGTTLSVIKLVDPQFQTATAPQQESASSEDQQYSGVPDRSERAESELNAPKVDPEELETLPPPPDRERPSPNARTPRATVPSDAPVPSLRSEDRSPVAPPVATADLPPALTLPSPDLDENAPSSLTMEANPAPSQAQLNDSPQQDAFTANQDAARSMPDSSTAFDVIPQVAEVRTYFQQRWQPPEGLNVDLQYSLTLNPNGSIQQVEPLGQASATYLDRTNIPLAGEPFVSTTANGSTPRIRLVLEPDGEVQTFLESR